VHVVEGDVGDVEILNLAFFQVVNELFELVVIFNLNFVSFITDPILAFHEGAKDNNRK
jgi:hypothetical protein